MNEIMNQYLIFKDQVSTVLKGPLTSDRLSELLGKIKVIAKNHLSATPEDVQLKLINEAKAYVPPKELDNGTLTANIVMESLAVSILIDEYFMTLTNLPGLKDHLWNELVKNGITFDIWSNIDKALGNSK
ncbi:MAG: hypothetical protein BA867_00720 [Desulfobacterales bacterium S5133MH16]|nr:MAG: hypothetical protein BA867_00720 [Desulfobacterales bacterium S5133MH16]